MVNQICSWLGECIGIGSKPTSAMEGYIYTYKGHSKSERRPKAKQADDIESIRHRSYLCLVERSSQDILQGKKDFRGKKGIVGVSWPSVPRFLTVAASPAWGGLEQGIEGTQTASVRAWGVVIERVVIKDQGSRCGEFNPHASRPKLDKDIHPNCLIAHRINSTDHVIQDNANLLSSKFLESVNNKVQ